MIRIENVSVTLRGKKILKNVSCTIESGDFVLLVGANGAGKTTLFDLIAGKLKPSEGRIFINDADVTHLSEYKRSLMISRLFQNPGMNGVLDLTVEENLALSMYKGRHVSFASGLDVLKNKKMIAHLEAFGFNDPRLLHAKMSSLSGGQRQQLAFLMATGATHPELLLLDEPTAALDPQTATKLLLNVIAYIKQQVITTLMITHDPQLALTIGNKVWVISDGSLVAQYSAEEKKKISPDQLVGHIQYDLL
jgi:putative tryptophan/tyrosine transport system ATP-binding protein